MISNILKPFELPDDKIYLSQLFFGFYRFEFL